MICASPVINFTAILHLPNECGIFPISETGVIVEDGDLDLQPKTITELTKNYSNVLRNPGRDIFFPIFTRKEIVKKRTRKEIKTIISRLNDLSSFLSNIEQNRN